MVDPTPPAPTPPPPRPKPNPPAPATPATRLATRAFLVAAGAPIPEDLVTAIAADEAAAAAPAPPAAGT